MVDVAANIENTGDASFVGGLNRTLDGVDGDAGTPDNTTDDFTLILNASGSQRLRSFRHAVPCEQCGEGMTADENAAV